MDRKIKILFVLLFPNFLAFSASRTDTLLITIDNIADSSFYLSADRHISDLKWYYHLGDNEDWAKTDYDHSNWEKVSPFLNSEDYDIENWQGIAWFRIIIKIDSTLKNKSIGMYVHHEGSSELYINGNKIKEFGKVGTSSQDEVPFDPQYYPYIFAFNSSLVYTFAVRYSNQSVIEHEYTYRKFFGHIGFSIELFDFNSSIKKSVDKQYSTFIYQWAINGFSAAFSIIFFLLYFFYSKRKENLFFALFSLGIFIFSMAISLEYSFLGNIEAIALLRILNFTGISLVFIYLLLFIYYVVYKRIIKLFWIFIISFLIFNLISFFGSESVFSNVIPLLIIIVSLSIEAVRVVIVGLRRRIEHIAIIAGGVVLFLLSFFFMVVVSYLGIRIENFILDIIGIATIISIPLSMAIYLAKSFQKTNSDLEEQIIQVQDLSEKKIEQERRNAELIIQAERERTENERKTQELEEARKLQLSMLPKELPNVENLDIAVFMQTATEVGGDYYDFSVKDDGSLNICLGDATGHGLKAGTIVSMMKSLFIANSINNDIKQFFITSNNALKNSKLDKMMMAFAMINIDRANRVNILNAGIPPVFIYRSKTRKVEEIKINGLPLGAMRDTIYNAYKTELSEGDILIMLSDGMPELRNEEDEMYGYERLFELLSNCGELSSSEIIEKFKDESSYWIKDKDPQDDLTFVVIKVK